MKYTIKIIAFINKLSMLVFTTCLLSSMVNNDFLYYSLWIAFFLGIFQVACSFVPLITWNRLNKSLKKNVLIYLFVVIFYFLIWYLLDHFKMNNRFSIVIYILFTIPILLSFYFTYFIELFKNRIG